MELSEVPRVSSLPGGYRTLGYFQEMQTELGAMFDYYGARIWIPKRALLWCMGRFHAPKWAVESAKRFAEKR